MLAELGGYSQVRAALCAHSNGAGTPEWGRAEPAGGQGDAAWELLTVEVAEGREGEGQEEWDGKSHISLKAGMP